MDVRAVEEFVARFLVAKSSKKKRVVFDIVTNTTLFDIIPCRDVMELCYENTTLRVETKEGIHFLSVPSITGMRITTT